MSCPPTTYDSRGEVVKLIENWCGARLGRCYLCDWRSKARSHQSTPEPFEARSLHRWIWLYDCRNVLQIKVNMNTINFRFYFITNFVWSLVCYRLVHFFSSVLRGALLFFSFFIAVLFFRFCFAAALSAYFALLLRRVYFCCCCWSIDRRISSTKFSFGDYCYVMIISV